MPMIHPVIAAASALLMALSAGAKAPSAAAGVGLPAPVAAALKQAQIPLSAVSVVVQAVGATAPSISVNAGQPQNPASVFKLVTTYAALDTLGPAWSWATPVLHSGSLRGDVLEGDLFIKGQGDPKLVPERVWLLLRQLRQRGLREIKGDIVLDRSAFHWPSGSAGDFDGEASRPYNVRPDALLINYKSVTLRFLPEGEAKLARVVADPPLAGVTVQPSVPLSSGDCGDWRSALKAVVDDPLAVRFAGSYPAPCGERDWPIAYADPDRYAARMMEAAWRDVGGSLLGHAREGQVLPGAVGWFEFASPPLSEVVRDTNKFSNNVMAEQIFLTLALQARGGQAGSANAGLSAGLSVGIDAARETLIAWLKAKLGADAGGIVIDNGSGLSRNTRISAAQLAHLLQQAYASPVMPELMQSLAISGVDGTLKRSRAPQGRAHLKTGSLRDVVALAGYVLAQDGGRHVVVALVNHERAGAARPALDALVEAVQTQALRTDNPPRN